MRDKYKLDEISSNEASEWLHRKLGHMMINVGNDKDGFVGYGVHYGQFFPSVIETDEDERLLIKAVADNMRCISPNIATVRRGTFLMGDAKDMSFQNFSVSLEQVSPTPLLGPKKAPNKLAWGAVDIQSMSFFHREQKLSSVYQDSFPVKVKKMYMVDPPLIGDARYTPLSRIPLCEFHFRPGLPRDTCVILHIPMTLSFSMQSSPCHVADGKALPQAEADRASPLCQVRFGVVQGMGFGSRIQSFVRLHWASHLHCIFPAVLIHARHVQGRGCGVSVEERVCGPSLPAAPAWADPWLRRPQDVCNYFEKSDLAESMGGTRTRTFWEWRGRCRTPPTSATFCRVK